MTTEVLLEAKAGPSAKAAVANGSHGVRRHMPPVKIPSEAVIHLVLAGMTGEDHVTQPRELPWSERLRNDDLDDGDVVWEPLLEKAVRVLKNSAVSHRRLPG